MCRQRLFISPSPLTRTDNATSSTHSRCYFSLYFTAICEVSAQLTSYLVPLPCFSLSPAAHHGLLYAFPISNAIVNSYWFDSWCWWTLGQLPFVCLSTFQHLTCLFRLLSPIKSIWSMILMQLFFVCLSTFITDMVFHLLSSESRFKAWF